MQGNIPKMRGYKEAVAELKAADPNTAVTEYMLRKAVKEGFIPCVHVARRDLLCMENVYDFLQNPGKSIAPADGKIRRVI